MKGKDRHKRKDRGTKKWKMNLFEKMSDEATARKHNSIVSEVPFLFKPVVT